MNKTNYQKAQDVLPRMTLAIETLILGEGDARFRLYHAMTSISPLLPEDFPENHICKIREIYNSIGNIDKFKLTYIDYYIAKKEGTYKVYFKKIQNRTAVKYIKIIYGIYRELKMIEE